MRLHRSTSFAMFFLLLTSAVMAGRPWPNTIYGVHHFSDQLSNGMTSEQIAFAANHLVGCQKLTRGILDPIRTINPNFILLDYILGFGIGDFSHPEGYSWVADPYEDLTENHSDFFLTHPSSSWPNDWIRQTDWDWWVLDPGIPSYRDWFVSESLRRRALNLSDGVFADSCSYPWNTDPTQWWPSGQTQFEFWDPRLNGFMTSVRDQFAGELDPFYLIPNAGGLVTTVSQIDYTLSDGVMVEQFAMWGPGTPFDSADWELQMNRILSLNQAGKVVIAQNYMDLADYESRMFYTACYLLCKGSKTYLAMVNDFGLEWYPEYDIPIGSYSSLPASISNLWIESAGLYRRDYQNGMVLVNPSPSDPVVYALGVMMYRVSASGGGPVPANGIPSGSLAFQAVTSVNLGPNDAAILVSSQTPPPTPSPVPSLTAVPTFVPVPAVSSAGSLIMLTLISILFVLLSVQGKKM